MSAGISVPANGMSLAVVRVDGGPARLAGIFSPTNGLSSAMTRFDRAAQAVVTNAELDVPEAPGTAVVASDAGGLANAMVGMFAARFAFNASLETMKVSHEMLGEVIKLGDYGLSADRAG